MTGDDECDQYSLEQNGFKHENTLCNVIGIKKTDWYWKELNGFQHEGFVIKHDEILLPS